MFSATQATARHQPRGDDVEHDQFHERVKICQVCPLRRSHRCKAANQFITFLARQPTPACPDSRWPGQNAAASDPLGQGASPAFRIPRSLQPPMSRSLLSPVSRLAVLTVYFNFGRRPIWKKNFDTFAAGIRSAGVPLFTVEVALDDDPFELQRSSHVLQIRGTRERHQLWQKERALGELLKWLNGERDPRPKAGIVFDALAWIDCDIKFLNRDWARETLRALERCQVVQLFEDTYHLTEAGSIEIRRDAMHQGGRVESVGAHFAKHGTANGHPGLAWAARADWLRTYGFEDSHVTTGGDVSMVRAFTQLPDPCNFYRDASAGFMNWMGRWAEPVSQAVDRRFAFVPGTILHLWHGPTGERRYRERWRALMDNAFDPATDLVIDPNGLWAWSDAARAAKPRMIEAVAALVGR